MKTRRIGTLSVSEVGLGCNNFGARLDYPASEAVVHAALSAGITFFDTADIYGGTKSEEFLGRALGSRRDTVFIATKFGMAVDAEGTGRGLLGMRERAALAGGIFSIEGNLGAGTTVKVSVPLLAHPANHQGSRGN